MACNAGSCKGSACAWCGSGSCSGSATGTSSGNDNNVLACPNGGGDETPGCWCGRDCGGKCGGTCSGGCSGCSGDCAGSCSGCTGQCLGLCNNGCSGNADANAYNRLKEKKLIDYITNEDWDDLASILTQCYKCKLLAKDSQYPNNLWPVSQHEFITSSFVKTLIKKLKEVNASSQINEDNNGIVYNIIPLTFAQQMLDDTVNAYNIIHGKA